MPVESEGSSKRLLVFESRYACFFPAGLSGSTDEGFCGLSRIINAMKAAHMRTSATITNQVKLSIIRVFLDSYDSGPNLNCEAAWFIGIFDAEFRITFGQFILTDRSEESLDQFFRSRYIFGLHKNADFV